MVIGSLQPGARLGPYEIVSQLGVGGMGEVYRARDSQLKRDVALKILPADVTADADLARRRELDITQRGRRCDPDRPVYGPVRYRRP